MSLVRVKRVDILDDEAAVDVKISKLEVRPGEPILRAGDFRLSWGTARALHCALKSVFENGQREAEA